MLKYTLIPWQRLNNLTVMISTALIISSCASLETPDQVGDAKLSNQLLQKIDERDLKIAERDKVIDDLMRRVQQLEKTNIAYLEPNRPANTTSNVSTTNPTEKIALASTSENQAPVQNKTAPNQQKTSSSGSFLVDENAAQRALERTLVQTGALLLPYGLAEIQPYSTYIRRESLQPAFNGISLGNNSYRSNEFDMGVNLLVGMPFESQAEIRIPYQVNDQSLVIPNGNNSQQTVLSNSSNSLGDTQIGFAKTLTHERDWIPDLTGRLKWNIGSGSMAMGGGYNGFIASMTALKRQDPLAFTAIASYEKFLKKNGNEPGNQYNFTLATTLAASPQTSLSIGLQQTYVTEAIINNATLPGSDFVSSFFTVGAASTIGRSLFFSTTGGIGLTNSSPAYFLNITIPFRFDNPFKSVVSSTAQTKEKVSP